MSYYAFSSTHIVVPFSSSCCLFTERLKTISDNTARLRAYNASALDAAHAQLSKFVEEWAAAKVGNTSIHAAACGSRENAPCLTVWFVSRLVLGVVLGGGTCTVQATQLTLSQRIEVEKDWVRVEMQRTIDKGKEELKVSLVHLSQSLSQSLSSPYLPPI